MAIAKRLRIAHAIGVVFVGWNRHTTFGPVCGAFVQHAGGFALDVEHEVAIFGIRSATHQAQNFAGLGIQAGIVAITGDDIAGPVGDGCIKHMAIEIMIGEYSGVPADTVYPRALAGLCKTAQGLLQFSNGGHFIERRALAVVIAAILQMNVSVLKAWQYQAPAGINNARGFSRE